MEADEGADGDAEDAAEGDEPQKAPKGKKAKAAPAASQDRIKVVAAAVSDDAGCKGKADLALSMLADDDFAALSGSALVKLIGKTPVDGASASNESPDDAARAEMQAAITSTGNSNIDANGKPGASVQQNSASVWDQAHTLNNFIPG